MERKNYMRNFLAGIFFLGGLSLIVFVFLTVGQEKGFSRPKFAVTVIYRNVSGLMEGAPVLLAGVSVGNVSKIDFLEKAVDGRKVKVVLSIFEQYKEQLYKGSNFAVKTEGILGEKIVEIDINEEAVGVDLSKPIIGEEPLDVQDLAGVFAKAAESLTKTSEDLSKIDIAAASKGMGETTEALMNTSKGINEMMAQMQDISVKAKRLLNRVEKKVIEGTLFKVF
ncbi:MAG: MCE family protein [Candidatus Omnitrophica bacterium]|nr:MCE family protein [Candidatus Omnitrophota bacterium]